jgi:hypothetical protein
MASPHYTVSWTLSVILSPLLIENIMMLCSTQHPFPNRLKLKAAPLNRFFGTIQSRIEYKSFATHPTSIPMQKKKHSIRKLSSMLGRVRKCTQGSKARDKTVATTRAWKPTGGGCHPSGDLRSNDSFVRFTRLLNLVSTLLERKPQMRLKCPR